MDKKISCKLIIISFILLFFFVSKYAFCAGVFDLLQPTLTEGGYRLEIDTANPYRGVKLEVNSDVAVQYEIVQKINIPIENRDNPGQIIPSNNFVMRRIDEGNATGTFYVQPSDMRVSSVERIYTSSTAGAAVNFTLVYGITDIPDIPSGHYYGKLAFTLRPISSNRDQVTKFLDVYITVGEEGLAEPIIEIAASTGSKVITLNSLREEQATADVVAKINGRFKKVFSIYQIIGQPLVSSDGSTLDYEAVSFETKEIAKGMGMPLTSLTSQPQTIYTSGPNGEAPESFVVTYSLGDLSGQRAGKYAGNIKYFLKQADKDSFLGMISLEVENEKIFELMVAPQDLKGTIDFSNLKPDEPPRQNEVVLEVKTNTGKQYQVAQKVNSGLKNKEGGEIPPKFFTLRTDKVEVFNIKGTLKFPEKQEVKEGETVLFVSDTSGSPVKFKVVYELVVDWNVKAGDYSAGIVYSLVEL